MSRPSPQALWLSIGAGAATALIGWLFGVVPLDAVLVGLVVTAAFLAPLWIGAPNPVNWPQPPSEVTHSGWYVVRRLAATLDRASSDPSTYQRSVKPRLAQLVHERCRELGSSPSDPHIVDLFHSTATSRATHRFSGGPAEVEYVLDRLEELAETDQEGRS